MDLNQLKEKLNAAEFSPEVLTKLNEILDAAIQTGSLSDEAKRSMLDLIDLEIEGSEIESDTLEEVAMALDNFAGSVDNALESAARGVDEVTEELTKESEEIDSQATPQE